MTDVDILEITENKFTQGEWMIKAMGPENRYVLMIKQEGKLRKLPVTRRNAILMEAGPLLIKMIEDAIIEIRKGRHVYAEQILTLALLKARGD